MSRIFLTSDTTFYVSPAGSDDNDGLTPETPFRTGQHAHEHIVANYDCGEYTATVQWADGTYNAGVNVFGSAVGGGAKSISPIKHVGNLGNPSAVIISTTDIPCFSCTFGELLVGGGFKLTSTSASGFYISGRGVLSISGEIDYGSCGQYHQHANMMGCIVDAASSKKISGSAACHLLAQKYSAIEVCQSAVTITNSPNFSIGFAAAMSGYIIDCGMSFSGSATGRRYWANQSSVIDTGGAGQNHFPGNVAGSLFDQARYI